MFNCLEIYDTVFVIVNTRTSVGSIPACVLSKILEFGLLDVQKNHTFAAHVRLMLDFDAQ